MNKDHIVDAHTNRQKWLANLYGNVVYNNVPIISDLFSLVFFNASLPLWTIIITLIMVRRKRDFFEWEFTKKMNAVGL